MFGAYDASIETTSTRRGIAKIAAALLALATVPAAGRAEEAKPAGQDKTDAKVETAAPIEKPRIAPSNVQLKLDAVLHDLSQLPSPVAMMRSRILAAAHSGDLKAVKELITSGDVSLTLNGALPDEPIKMWRKQYPESDGIEILAILAGVLETDFVRLNAGSEQEIYVWPYFAHVPLKELDPPRLVELYRLLTAFDVQRLREAGAYTFFRVGIGADGTWQFFVSGAPQAAK